jgi:hypothetical protein
MTEENKILDADWLPVDEGDFNVSFKNLDDGANPRIILKVNASAKAPFYSIIEAPNQPPLAVCIVRADQDVVALGILEKLKIMVHQMQVKFNIGAKLTQGVRGVDLKNLPPINGKSH